MLSGLGIIVGFIVITVGVWKRFNLILVCLIASAIMGLFSGLSILATWSGPFMEGFSSFAAPFLTLFVAGALFGKLLDHSGATWRIGTTIIKRTGERWSLFAYFIVTALLIYGGVSVFVVVFVLLPIARSIFKKANIAWYLFPMVSAAGIIFPMAMMPGNLQIHNVIPTRYLGTDLLAAPVLGLLGSVIFVSLFFFYLKYELNRSEKKVGSPEYIPPLSDQEPDDTEMEQKAPGFILAILPIILALVLINILKINVVYGLFIACVSCIVLFWRSFHKKIDTLNSGIMDGILPLVYVAMVVGIGKTVTATPAFVLIRDWLMNLQLGGLMKVFAITNIFAAVTGSSSGSMTMSLEMFSKDYLAMGVDPSMIHRIITTSSAALDTLPWCSVIVLVLSLASLSYKQAYKQVFVVSVIFPLICALAMIAFAHAFLL
jgi:H+/gluconate symporter-like permease